MRSSVGDLPPSARPVCLPTNLADDPTRRDPDLVAMRGAIRNRDWPAVIASFDKADDHDGLTYDVSFAANFIATRNKASLKEHR